MRIPIHILVWAAASVMNLSVNAHAYYSAKPITARIVDANTGQPIAGANVVAAWILEDPTSGNSQGDLQLMEDVTDGTGEFHLPGWGRKPVPPRTRLTNEDPRIIVFKAGYFPSAVYNDSHPTLIRDPQDMGPAIRDSQWDGKTIPLKKFDGSLRLYASLVHGVLSDVGFAHCGWKRIPRMIIVLNKESDRLMAEKVVPYPSAWPSIDELTANETAECGPVSEYLKGFQK
jgi:hypothetical protein